MNKLNVPKVYFAWDNPKEDLTEHFSLYAEYGKWLDKSKRVVYVLTNYQSCTMKIYTTFIRFVI